MADCRVYRSFLRHAVRTVLELCRQDTVRWNYENGVALCALQGAASVLPASEAAAISLRLRELAETLVAPDGAIRGYRVDEFNIDQVNSGKFLLSMWDETRDGRYKAAVGNLLGQMEKHPRTASGAFWHKKIYPHQVWLDGLYMAGPFLARAAIDFGRPALLDEACFQLLHARDVLRLPESGLYRHAIDESRQQRWCDPATGLSPHVWGRAVGWLSMALVDLLDWLPAAHPQRAAIEAMALDLARAILREQQASGLWYQVMDAPGREGNYLEASASAMFAYFLRKGIREGILPTGEFDEAAWKALDGIMLRFMSLDDAGRFHLSGICRVAGLGGTPYRDGSYAYYLSEPVVTDDYKGLGPFVMALTEACRHD